MKLSAEIYYIPGAEAGSIDENALINIYSQIRNISARNNINFSPDLTQFLLIPGILENSAAESVTENLQLWDELTLSACESLNNMKLSEGMKLFNYVQDELKHLSEIAKNLRERWKIARDEALESLRTRIENVMEHYNLEIDANRVAQEVSLMSDKWDVTEELTRIDAHIEKFTQIMNEKISSGKKLDFLIQEMNREINTMGSKVADALFRWEVVEAKSCIEKIREQIQNIE